MRPSADAPRRPNYLPPMPPKLFLIDGYALIYRAFFAMISRPLRTTKGENTSAAWGVVNFLIRLREKHRPDYLAWINDAGTSFREERYAEYKSTREKLDDELQSDFDRSLERICALLEAFRIPIVTVPGYEADDVIGTLATRAAERGDLQAVIVSGDKDFYQLIGPRVCLLNPGRGGPAAVDESWVDESNADERLGVPPHQVVDFLALVGDTSDNVPGVKGIGEKGAQKLLAEYGTLENLLEHAAEVTAKRSREALLEQADNARLSKELVTIKRDVPVEIEIETLKAGEPDTDRLVKLATELEFASLARRFLDGDGFRGAAAPAQRGGDGGTAVDTVTPAAAPVRAEPCATVVTSVAQLPAIIERLRAAPLVAIDAETSSLEPHSAEIVGLSFAASPTDVWYFPFGHRIGGGELVGGGPAAENLPPLTDPALAGIRELLSDPSVPKAGHNIKYCWQVLRRVGIELGGVAYDSMLASFVLEPGRRTHAIDALALEHFGRSMRTYADLVGKGRNEIPFAEVAVAAAADYCGDDSATVLALHDFFAEQLRLTGMERLLREIELPLVPVVVDMEWDGITIDRALLSKISAELGADLTRLEEDIAREAGEDLNLNSPRQLATVLFDKLQLPVTKKTKTGPSTDADVLEGLKAMGHRLPELILEHRELQKLKSTYVDSLPLEVNAHTGRIHTSFSQIGAATGRLASSDPNLQNIPIRTPRGAEIRKSFIPAKGCTFVVADYSQIELRLMAHLSGDPAFIEAFQRGGDIHRQTAAVMFKVPVEDVTGEMRAAAKTINFATIYGQGAFALSRKINVSIEDARTFIKEYFERFSGVRDYLDRQVRLAREQGYVETISGRRRYIPEIRDRNFNMRAYGERTAQNSPLQGSAADLIKIAMIGIHGALKQGGMASRMLLQVHDELVLEAPPDEIETVKHIVRKHMEGAAELRVPLVVDIGTGPNWLDAKH